MSFFKLKKVTPNSSKGFTLIELLVVISIIGLLSSIVLSSLSSTRIKARDARRRADIKQYSLALEFYYDKYGGYPWDTFNGYEQPCITTTNNIGQLVTAGFLSSLSCDLLNSGTLGSGYGYYFDPDGTCAAGICTQVCLYANLEGGDRAVFNGGAYPGCF